MKKKKTNKKLPRYDLGTMKRGLPLGYQPTKGIGDATFSVEQGQSIEPEIRAMRENRVPNAINQASQTFGYPLQALQHSSTARTATSFLPKTNLTTINTFANTPLQSLSTTLPTWMPTSGVGGGGLLGSSMSSLSNGASQLGSLSASSPSAFFGTTSSTTGSTAAGASSSAASKSASGVLGGAGIALNAIGAAYGGYSMYNDIANAGSHRTAADMQNTRSKSTYTTAGGNTYDIYGNPNLNAELAYENEARKAKQTSFAINSIGTGASIGGLAGSIIPGLGNLLGTGIGAGVGALIGGLGSLFGFGDNEDEVREEMRNEADATARQNMMAQAVGKSKDLEGSAANGKRPVWTPEGLIGKKASARVSNGEIVGNLAEGVATRIPGRKNNKDTKLAALSDGDFVISNKYGLSDYAAATGDYLGALNLQEMLLGKMRNKHGYKCGKLPKRALGQFGEYALSALPHLGGLMGNIARYNRAKNADTYAPNLYVEDAEGRAAVNQLANLRYDVTPYLRDAQRALNQQNWNVRRNVGLGLGGRAIAQNANFQAYLNNLANVYNAKNEADNKYTAMYADALAKLGAQNRQYRTAALNNQFQWKQQQNAAKENWLDQVQKDKYTVASSLASDIMRVNQYNEARALENKKLGLYQQQVDIDRIKALQGLNNNSTSTSETPTFRSPIWTGVFRPEYNGVYIPTNRVAQALAAGVPIKKAWEDEADVSKYNWYIK